MEKKTLEYVTYQFSIFKMLFGIYMVDVFPSIFILTADKMSV